MKKLLLVLITVGLLEQSHGRIVIGDGAFGTNSNVNNSASAGLNAGDGFDGSGNPVCGDEEEAMRNVSYGLIHTFSNGGTMNYNVFANGDDYFVKLESPLMYLGCMELSYEIRDTNSKDDEKGREYHIQAKNIISKEKLFSRYKSSGGAIDEGTFKSMPFSDQYEHCLQAQIVKDGGASTLTDGVLSISKMPPRTSANWNIIPSDGPKKLKNFNSFKESPIYFSSSVRSASAFVDDKGKYLPHNPKEQRGCFIVQNLKESEKGSFVRSKLYQDLEKLKKLCIDGEYDQLHAVKRSLGNSDYLMDFTQDVTQGLIIGPAKEKIEEIKNWIKDIKKLDPADPDEREDILGLYEEIDEAAKWYKKEVIETGIQRIKALAQKMEADDLSREDEKKYRGEIDRIKKQIGELASALKRTTGDITKAGASNVAEDVNELLLISELYSKHFHTKKGRGKNLSEAKIEKEIKRSMERFSRNTLSQIEKQDDIFGGGGEGHIRESRRKIQRYQSSMKGLQERMVKDRQKEIQRYCKNKMFSFNARSPWDTVRNPQRCQQAMSGTSTRQRFMQSRLAKGQQLLAREYDHYGRLSDAYQAHQRSVAASSFGDDLDYFLSGSPFTNNDFGYDDFGMDPLVGANNYNYGFGGQNYANQFGYMGANPQVYGQQYQYPGMFPGQFNMQAPMFGTGYGNTFSPMNYPMSPFGGQYGSMFSPTPMFY